MLDTPTAEIEGRLRNGLETELVDWFAVEGEFLTLEGLRDALTVVRRSPEWGKDRAFNAATTLIDQIDEAVSRVRRLFDECIAHGADEQEGE